MRTDTTERKRRGARAAERPAERPARGGAEGLPETYFAGEAVACPVGCGGVCEVVRVNTTPEGGGEVWLECRSCAQRASYGVTPASDGERAAVRDALGAGREVLCARHTRRLPLQRRGRQLVCPECGVRYRE